MLDHLVNDFLHPKLGYISNFLPSSFSANKITLIGFFIGLLAVPLISFEFYNIGLIIILINRFFDGLDGAVARRNGITSFGGYLDILCDFIFYSAVIFGFTLANPDRNGMAATFLLFSFVGTGTSFLAFAVIEKKHHLMIDANEKKSFFYMRGLIEGLETIIFYIIVCLFPEFFPQIAIIFGFFCWVTVFGRIVSAYHLLG